MRASSLALLIVAFAAPFAWAQSKDDAAVFDASLAKFSGEFERSHKVAPKFLVFDETAAVLAHDLGFTMATKDVPKQLVDALLTYNGVSQPIGSYSPPSPFRLSSAKMLGPALEVAKPGLARPRYYKWDLLRAQFPDVAGILEFAWPAYSPDHTSALVYFWTSCGNDCASGYVYMLEESGGSWKVVKTYPPWIE